VRVMRLYKPGFHLVHSLPPIHDALSESPLECPEASGGGDFTLSPFLLLPDSFGDIYVGEKFSAYIAVVNGYTDIPFHHVSLAVRLQSSTTVIDLADTRPDPNTSPGAMPSRTLSVNDSFDVVVQQTLTELGIHTLRVSVQYMLTPHSEPKTLRKFYRFNVLQPLVIQSSCVEVNGMPMVQCEVTNATKSAIYIDELEFVAMHKDSQFEPLVVDHKPPAAADDNQHNNVRLEDALIMLQTGESHAFAFRFTQYTDLSGRPPGYPQLKWCAGMGEFSVYRGEFTQMKTFSASFTQFSIANAGGGGGGTQQQQLQNQQVDSGVATAATGIGKGIKYTCMSKPISSFYVGEEQEVVIRLVNTTQRTMSIHLDCKHSSSSNSSKHNSSYTSHAADSHHVSDHAASHFAAYNPITMGGALSSSNSSSSGNIAGDGNSAEDLRPRLLSSGAPAGSTSFNTLSSALTAAASGGGVAGSSTTSSYSGYNKNNNSLTTSTLSASATAATAGGRSVMHSYYGLCFTGLTFTPLGMLEGGDFLDVTVKICAISAGLHVLPTFYVIDSLSGEKYSVSNVCHLLIVDNIECEEEEEEEEDDGKNGDGGLVSCRLPQNENEQQGIWESKQADQASVPLSMAVDPSAAASSSPPAAAAAVAVVAATTSESQQQRPSASPIPLNSAAAVSAVDMEEKEAQQTPITPPVVPEVFAPLDPSEAASFFESAAPILPPLPPSPSPPPPPPSAAAATAAAAAEQKPSVSGTSAVVVENNDSIRDTRIPAPTEQLFLTDTYLYHCTATLLLFRTTEAGSSEAKHGSHALVASRTVFHPQGGGQPSDVGTIKVSFADGSQLPFPVSFACKSRQWEGVVEHFGTPDEVFLTAWTQATAAAAAAAAMAAPIVGTLSLQLQMQVDEEVRRQSAVCHSAGHAMDAAMHRCGFLSQYHLKATKGYHFTDGPYVEYEITSNDTNNTNNTNSSSAVTPEVMNAMVPALNRVLQAIVAEGISTQVALLSRTAAAEQVCGAGEERQGGGSSGGGGSCDMNEYPEEVRVVTVAGYPCPCGGTHVASTLELEGCEVTKIKKKKSTLKVSYQIKGKPN